MRMHSATSRAAGLPALILACLLWGCGATGTIRFDVPVVAGDAPFAFADVRPQAERSGAVQPAAVGTQARLGDSAIEPRPADLVRAWLHSTRGAALRGRHVELREFRVEVVDPGGRPVDPTDVMTATGPAGILAYPLIAAYESSRTTKVVYVYITLAIDGVEMKDTSVGTYQARVTESNINEVLRRSLQRISEQIAR